MSNHRGPIARPASWLALAVLALVLGCNREPIAQVDEMPLPTADELQARIDDAIDFAYANRHLNTADQAAWQIVHGALMFGRNYQVYHDGKLVGAIDYMFSGQPLRGWVLHKGDHGLEAVLDAGSKTGMGHEDQWLGYLSQCGVKTDDKIIADGQTYTVQDLITQSQWDIYEGMEATWTLMAFSTYLPLDAQWTAKDGSTWTIERIVRMETAQPLGDSACGGSHRMFALALALQRYLASGGKLSADNPDGTWEKCQQKISAAVASAKQYQQPDGALSSNYFERPAGASDIVTRIGTTGHTLEFLMVALDDNEIQQPWVTRAVANLLGNFEKTKKFPLECGALYHAMRGLDLYRLRRFGSRKELTPLDPDHSSESDTVAPVEAAASEPKPEGNAGAASSGDR
jgi:hypothetical protein